MTDDDLRRLYQRTTGSTSSTASSAGGAERPSGRTDACVAPEELVLLARREGDERTRLAILDHVMACDACQRDLDLVRAADRAASQMAQMAQADHAVSSVHTPHSVVGMIRRTWMRPVSTLLAAAVALVAIGLTVRTMRTHGPAGVSGGGDVLRGAPARDATPGIRLIAPAPDARTERPVTLMWHAAPAARGDRPSYHVEVLDSAGAAVLITDGVRDTTLMVSSRILAPGTNYSWWVSTAVPGGTRRSPLIRFHVAT